MKKKIRVLNAGLFNWITLLLEHSVPDRGRFFVEATSVCDVRWTTWRQGFAWRGGGTGNQAAVNEATRCKCNLEKPSCISFTLCSFSLLQYSKCYTSPVLFLWSLWGIVRSFVFQKPAASYWTPEIGCCLEEKNYQKFHIVLAFS